jgi:hypothetical protein
MKRNFTIALLPAILITSCEIDDWDYRNKFTDDYIFEITYSYTTYVGDVSNGYFVSGDTTYFYAGSVKKSVLNPNEVNVNWGNNILSIEGDEIDQHKTRFQIDSDGILSSPEISEGLHRPAYIHGDTIRFIFYTGNGMAHQLSSTWMVIGLMD